MQGKMVDGTQLSEEKKALESLLDRMPPEVASSFTEEQLAHLHSALGARSWKSTPLIFVQPSLYRS